MKSRKRVTFTKPIHFKHKTEGKKKNMIGRNPEVQKKEAIKQALHVQYTSNSTGSPEAESLLIQSWNFPGSTSQWPFAS